MGSPSHITRGSANRLHSPPAEAADRSGSPANDLEGPADRPTGTQPADRTLVAELVHELRAPLAALVLLSTGQELSADDHNTLRTLAAHLTGVVDRFTARTRPAAMSTTEMVPAGELADGAIIILTASRPARPVDVTVTAPAAGVTVDVDRVAVTQILVNLLVNADRHAPATTPLRVTVDADAHHVRVTVCDDGPGVDTREHELVFVAGATCAPAGDPYRRGLGLAVSRRIAETMGGTLTVDADQRGGCFTVHLPRR